MYQGARCIFTAVKTNYYCLQLLYVLLSVLSVLICIQVFSYVQHGIGMDSAIGTVSSSETGVIIKVRSC